MELQRVIFGIDISTSRIGISAVTTDEKLVFSDTITFKKKAFAGGKTTANTMAKLQRFNGMCCYAIHKSIFNLSAQLLPARTCRSLNEIKIPRGANTKKLIIDWVSAKYPKDFTYELTRHGNPKVGTCDRADAVVTALAGLKKYKQST
jgi:hypothetical protein